jgi:hypothetical protein
MPVLRTTRTYRHKGRKRFVRLYKAWHNMQERVRGVQRDGSGNAIWYGLEIEWGTYEEFHAWAVAAGYSRINRSLDREDERKGYGPGNCVWTTVARNSAHSGFMRLRDPFEMGGRTLRGGTECPF